jgi:phosphatidylserine/phosphatidylglycerophosphate/cardiolipin synthase-like enzyme
MKLHKWLINIAVMTVFLFFCQSCSESHSNQAAAHTSGCPEIQVYFSPHGGCTDAVVDAIGQAKSEILVQAYSFTSAPIAKALV